LKKTTALLTSILIIILSVFLLGSCFGTNDTPPTTKRRRPVTKILALGDSIAEGIIGTEPESERNNYSYLEVVGQINKVSYENLAIGGSETKDLLDYILLKRFKDRPNPTTPITEADVIVISILGNDLLNHGFPEHLKNSLKSPPSFTGYDAVLSSSYKNLDKIVQRIRVLNSDATLIFQTLYNPIYPGSSKLMTPDYRQYIRENYRPGATEEDFYDMTTVLMDRLNNVLFRYLKANPNAFEILDVNKKFDTLHKNDSEKLERLICDDDGHPSNEGRAVIACLLQEWLENNNLATHASAFYNYKDLRKKQLTRLYADTSVDIDGTKALIDSAKTYDEVNDAYFDATYDIEPNVK
jgi:lysophospholipase L1-like esterase